MAQELVPQAIRAGRPTTCARDFHGRENAQQCGSGRVLDGTSSMAVMPKAAVLARTIVAVAMAAAAALGAPAVAQDAGTPEAGTGWHSGGLATATSHMVAAANPHAVEAGLEILRAGGSAADAAIAVQLVLNLVEPQSSGIGGGAFILHWDAAAKRARRPTTGARRRRPPPRRDRFLVDGQPRTFDEAVFGGLSVGVPGTRRPCWRLCTRSTAGCPGPGCSRRPSGWRREGFRVSPRLHLLLRWYGADSFRPGRAPLLLRYHRQRPPRRLPAQESGVRGHAARHRRSRRRRRSTRGPSPRRS